MSYMMKSWRFAAPTSSTGGSRDFATARITVGLDRLACGNSGDVKPVGEGVSELRIDHGPGYRIYFVRRGEALVFLLCSGDKGSQDRDIARAKAIAQTV